MSYLQSILLGILQGVAEFLPISSSGHLAVAQKLFGLEEIPLLFDVFLHLATLCAVVLYFRKKIWYLLCAFGRLIARRPAPVEVKNADGTKTVLTEQEAAAREKNLRAYIWAIILATVVTGVCGVLTSKLIDDNKLPVAFIFIGFLITAVLLVGSAIYEKLTVKNRSAESDDKSAVAFKKAPKWWQALLIGLAQGVGTLPGISRSGSTIAGSLFTGVDRKEAGDFSFIVSIPAILGAFILELKDLGEMSGMIGAGQLIAGCAAAFASGYVALTLLMRIIRKGRLEWFALYLVPVAVLGLIFIH